MKSKVIQASWKIHQLFYQNHSNCEIEDDPIQ